MKITKVLASALLCLTALTCFAETPGEAAVKKLIAPRLGEGDVVETVTLTPYAGLYEVRTRGGDILYTDSKAKYLFVGRIVNTQTYEDYTKARIEAINKVNFADLPFDSALKMVKGNGKRVIAVFEDPNCGYCKHFRQTLQGMDNITVYTFMFNILSEDSAVKSKNIWCAADRMKAWDDWMLNNKAPAAAVCATNPNEKVLALGKKMRITGTPTVFFTDGTRIPGAVDAKALEGKFASIK